MVQKIYDNTFSSTIRNILSLTRSGVVMSTLTENVNCFNTVSFQPHINYHICPAIFQKGSLQGVFYYSNSVFSPSCKVFIYAYSEAIVPCRLIKIHSLCCPKIVQSNQFSCVTKGIFGGVIKFYCTYWLHEIRKFYHNYKKYVGWRGEWLF